MNYYEELGIRQDAALEEIRQAYKLLARLLHPDAQPDARLKAMAEVPDEAAERDSGDPHGCAETPPV